MPSDHQWLLIQWGVVIGASLAAAVFDLSTRRIPNYLTGSLMLAGLIGAWWIAGWRGVGNAVGGGLVAGLPFVVLFVVAGGGAGDAKMMLGLGTWVGLLGGAILTAAVAVTGGLLAMAFAVARGQGQGVLGRMGTLVWGLIMTILTRGRPRDVAVWRPVRSQMLEMPYGPAIFVGACIAAGVGLSWQIGLTI